MIRAMAATLNNKQALIADGFISTYRSPMRKLGKMFSKSLRCALNVKLNQYKNMVKFFKNKSQEKKSITVEHVLHLRY